MCYGADIWLYILFDVHGVGVGGGLLYTRERLDQLQSNHSS